MDELDTMMNAENDTTGQPTNPDAVTAPKKKGTRKKKEKEAKEKKAPRDNIGRINAMTSIGEVRKALQISIAKKAKAAGKPDTQARYDTEIESAKAKLEELLASASSVGDLIAMGEEPNKIITHYIKDQEDRYEAWLKANDLKVSKRVQKAVSDDIADCFFKDLPVELHDKLVERHNKKDYRLRAACRNANLIAAVDAGTMIYDNGRWKDANGAYIGAEAKASETEDAGSDNTEG